MFNFDPTEKPIIVEAPINQLPIKALNLLAAHQSDKY